MGVKVWLDIKDTYISEIFSNKSQFNLVIFISSQFNTIRSNLYKYNS